MEAKLQPKVSAECLVLLSDIYYVQIIKKLTTQPVNPQ